TTGTCPTTGSTVGQVVTVTLTGTCAAAASTAVTLTIAGVTNNNVTTAQSLTVATGADGSAVTETSFTDAAATAPTTGAASPHWGAAQAWGTFTVTFGSGVSGALAAPDQIVTTFPAGFLIPATPAIAFTAGTTGTCPTT